MVNIPRKTLERKFLAQGYDGIIGVDEVGMGCLAGPVVVCATLFQPEFFIQRYPQLAYLRDSKLLQPRQREKFARELVAHRYIRHALAVVYPREIDRINIFQAARTGMRRAIKSIVSLSLRSGSRGGNLMVLVDGPHRIEGISCDQLAVVKGDRKIFSIAAASILAKVCRDAMMVRYARRYPGYGLEIHKGYATELHRQRIRELGPSDIHRRSFTL